MATQQTIDVLKSYVALLDGCGDSSGAEAIRALASALSAAGEAKIKTTVAKIQKFWKQSPEMASSPMGLDGRLSSLQDVLASGGAKSASADVQALVELLDSRNAVDPREFEGLLRSAIEAPVPTSQSKAAKKREPLSAAEVRQWADRLTAAATDQSAFETELSAVLAIPKLNVAELKSIAKHYLGYEPPKAKAAILKKLRARQMQDAMEAGRQSRLQRIAV